MKLRTLVMLCLLMVFSTVAFANHGPWQEITRETNSAGEVLWKMYFNKESVYKNEDGTVTFWAKYIPINKNIIEDYKPGILDHAKKVSGKEPVIKDKFYCVYRIIVDFETKQYQMSKHYWYNDDKEQSFITGYDAVDKWNDMTDKDEVNFKNVSNYVINK